MAYGREYYVVFFSQCRAMSMIFPLVRGATSVSFLVVVVVVNANCCVLPVIRAINIVEFGMMAGVVCRGVLEKFYKFENLSNLTDGSVYTMINRSDCHDLMKFLWNEF